MRTRNGPTSGAATLGSQRRVVYGCTQLSNADQVRSAGAMVISRMSPVPGSASQAGQRHTGMRARVIRLYNYLYLVLLWVTGVCVTNINMCRNS